MKKHKDNDFVYCVVCGKELFECDCGFGDISNIDDSVEDLDGDTR